MTAFGPFVPTLCIPGRTESCGIEGFTVVPHLSNVEDDPVDQWLHGDVQLPKRTLRGIASLTKPDENRPIHRTAAVTTAMTTLIVYVRR